MLLVGAPVVHSACPVWHVSLRRLRGVMVEVGEAGCWQPSHEVPLDRRCGLSGEVSCYPSPGLCVCWGAEGVHSTLRTPGPPGSHCQSRIPICVGFQKMTGGAAPAESLSLRGEAHSLRSFPAPAHSIPGHESARPHAPFPSLITT